MTQGRKKCLVLGVSSLLMIAGVEAALRIFWNNPFRGSDTDHILKLAHHHAWVDATADRRAIDPQTPRVRFRVDGRGRIEPACRFLKPDFSVAFLGGSTTECRAVREEMRFHAVVSKLLEERGLEVNTLNYARSGNTLHDSINVLFNHAVLDEPDVAVVMHAMNDSGILSAFGTYSPRMGKKASLADSAKYLLQWLSARSSLWGAVRNALGRGGLRPRPAGFRRDRKPADPGPFRCRLLIFIDICRDLGIEPVLMTQPQASRMANELTPAWTDPTAQNVFNQAIRAAARQRGARLIDLARVVAADVAEADDELAAMQRIFYDGTHVTDSGSKTYARIIADDLRDLLNSMKASRATQPAAPTTAPR